MRKRLIGKPAWRHSEVKDACVPSVTLKAAKKGETGNAIVWGNWGLGPIPLQSITGSGDDREREKEALLARKVLLRGSRGEDREMRFSGRE
jgi:hypothetical protein